MPKTAPFVYEGESTREISFPLGGIGTGSIGLSGAGRLIDWEIQNRPAKGITNGLSPLRGQGRAERQGARRAHPPRALPRQSHRRFSRRHVPQFRLRRPARFARRHAAFRDQHLRGPLPGRQARVSRAPSFRVRSGSPRSIPFIPLNDRDFEHPGGDVRGRVHQSDRRADHLHGGRRRRPRSAPADQGEPGQAQGRDRRQGDDRRARHRRAGLCRDRARDRQSLDQPPDPPLSAATGSMRSRSTGRISTGPAPSPTATTAPAIVAGGMGRNRDSSLLAGHVTVAPGETRDRPLRARLVHAELPQVLDHARSGTSASHRRPSGSGRTGTRPSGPAPRPSPPKSCRAGPSSATTPSSFRDAVYSSTVPRAGARRGRRQSLDPQVADDAPARGRHLLRLGGLPSGRGLCEGSCTHVWNYQQALPFLYPALERSMREADYTYNMNPAGGMSFRLSLPLGTNYTDRAPMRRRPVRQHAEALSRLEALGRHRVAGAALAARQAQHRIRLEPGQPGPLGPRADRRPLGPPAPHARHGAVRAELLADRLLPRRAQGRGRDGRCARRDGRGRALQQDLSPGAGPGSIENLFNGEYFAQQVDLADKTILAPFIKGEMSLGVLGDTVEALYWSGEHKELKYQLGDGCLIDQALGQWHATLYGLGDILDREKVVTSLQSIFRYNFKERLGDIYNPCRVFGMDDESGTVITTWPDESTQAGGAGAVRAGDHARHGVRLRPDADGLWHARGRREGHRRRPRPLRRRDGAIPGTRSSAARTMRARWRAGAP